MASNVGPYPPTLSDMMRFVEVIKDVSWPGLCLSVQMLRFNCLYSGTSDRVTAWTVVLVNDIIGGATVHV